MDGNIFGSLFGAAKRKWLEEGGSAVKKDVKKAKVKAVTQKERDAAAPRRRDAPAEQRVAVKPKATKPAPSERRDARGSGDAPTQRPRDAVKPTKPAPKPAAPAIPKPQPARPVIAAPLVDFDAFPPREKRDRSREKERKQKRKERLRQERGEDPDDAPQPQSGSRGGGDARADAGMGAGSSGAAIAALAAAAAAASGSGGLSGPKRKPMPQAHASEDDAGEAPPADAAAAEKPRKRPNASSGAGAGAGAAGGVRSGRKADPGAGPSGRPAGAQKAAARESRESAEGRAAGPDTVGKAARARQQRMLSAIRSRGEGSWGADDEGGDGGGGDDSGGDGGGESSKTAKKFKARQALLLKPELVTPAEKSGLSFEAEWHDHCETPFEAYQHVEPLLFKVAQVLGKTKEQLRIYDPYFCEGSMVRHLGRLGFTNVYNRNEDFYAVVERGGVPEHDVLVTNPPYSADHMQRCLRFCMANGRPWLLLLPNFVYRKRDYQSILGEDVVPFYLCPPKRYVYYAPGRQDAPQATSPFDSFWYCFLEPLGTSQEEFASWFENKYAKVSGCRMALTPADLPEDVVPVRLDKRPNPKARRRAQKRAVFIHKQFGVPMKHIRGGPSDDRG